MNDPIHGAYEAAHRGRDGEDHTWTVPVRLEFDVRVSAPTADTAAEQVAADFDEEFDVLLEGFPRDDIALTTGIPTKTGNYRD